MPGGRDGVRVTARPGGVWAGRRGRTPRPGRDGAASSVPTWSAGKPSSTAPVAEPGALLDARPGADDRPGADQAAVAHDRAGLDDGAGADVAAVDHRARADDHVVVDDQLVVGQQVQHRVLQDLHPGADADRAVRVADDLHAGADDRVLADDDVAGDLRGVEQHRRRGDRRGLVAVGVQLCPCVLLPRVGRCRRSCPGGRSGRSGRRAAASRSRSASVADAHARAAGRPTSTASSGITVPAGTSVPSPRMQPSPSREPGMRIAPLPISHRSPTLAPTIVARWPKTVRCPIATGCSGLPTSTPFSSTAEWLPIAHRRARERSDQALRQQRTGAEVRLTDQHRRGGDLGRGLLGPCPVETHPSASARSIDQVLCRCRPCGRTPSRVMRMAVPARPCALLLRRLFGQATGPNTVAGLVEPPVRVRQTVSSRHPWPPRRRRPRIRRSGSRRG